MQSVMMIPLQQPFHYDSLLVVPRLYPLLSLRRRLRWQEAAAPAGETAEPNQREGYRKEPTPEDGEHQAYEKHTESRVEAQRVGHGLVTVHLHRRRRLRSYTGWVPAGGREQSGGKS